MGKVIKLNHRRGKLVLCNTDYICNYRADVYFYVESHHYNPIDGIDYLDILAPSFELKTFVNNILSSGKITNLDLKVFENTYKQQLELKLADRVLKRLENYLQQGEDIVLFCDIKEIRLNHLVAVGEYFKKQDYKVEFKFELNSKNIDNIL